MLEPARICGPVMCLLPLSLTSHSPTGSHLRCQDIFVEDLATPNIPQIYRTSMDTYLLLTLILFLLRFPPFSDHNFRHTVRWPFDLRMQVCRYSVYPKHDHIFILHI